MSPLPGRPLRSRCQHALHVWPIPAPPPAQYAAETVSHLSGHSITSADTGLAYRPDIDGLRAIAVMLVLLFHADLGVPGGFIGVDVFFVISGYLMTALLLKDRGGQPPRLRDFYARRIRRIIPAATAMVIVVVAAGYLIMLPGEYVRLAKSAIAQQLMASNIYFWRNTGYFDGAAEMMPLLHTWSLSVEEQFYLAYPLLLVLLRKFRSPRKALTITMAIMITLSLGASIYGARYHPWGTFYMLPSRAWELLLGGLVCLIPPPKRTVPWLQAAATIAALAAILAASVVFTRHTRFPGAAALVPCLAAAVIIYANKGALRGPAALLGSRPLVAVGLISYSLYLWHWPVLAFARIGFDIGTESLPTSVAITCLAATFALAYASWRWIETPFRRAARPTTWTRPLAAAGICTLAVCSASAGIMATKGASWRFPSSTYPWLYERKAQFMKYSTSTKRVMEQGPVQLGAAAHIAPEGPEGSARGSAAAAALPRNIDFLVWGDSHAMATGPALEDTCTELGLRGAMMATSAMPPCLDIVQGNRDGTPNAQWCDAFKSVVEGEDVRGVLLIARWGLYVDAGAPQQMARMRPGDVTAEHAADALAHGLKSTIRWLTDRGTRVAIMLEMPRQPRNPVARYTMSFALGALPCTGVEIAEHRNRQARVAAVMESLRGEDVTILPVEAAAFDDNGLSRLGDGQGPFYEDNDHISPYGARQLLKPIFMDWVRGLKPTD